MVQSSIRQSPEPIRARALDQVKPRKKLKVEILKPRLLKGPLPLQVVKAKSLNQREKAREKKPDLKKMAKKIPSLPARRRIRPGKPQRLLK